MSRYFLMEDTGGYQWIECMFRPYNIKDYSNYWEFYYKNKFNGKFKDELKMLKNSTESKANIEERIKLVKVHAKEERVYYFKFKLFSIIPRLKLKVNSFSFHHMMIDLCVMVSDIKSAIGEFFEAIKFFM